jgi:hypothetical protein
MNYSNVYWKFFISHVAILKKKQLTKFIIR